RVEVPVDSPMGEQYVQVKTAGGLSNAVPLLVTDLPNVTRAESAEGGKPLPLSIPSAVSARLAKQGESHRYTFHAKAGQMFSFEVDARRFDSRIDSVLTLLNDKGQQITENDDAAGPDSRIDWQAGADGEYTLQIHDLTRGGGGNYVYLLTDR